MSRAVICCRVRNRSFFANDFRIHTVPTSTMAMSSQDSAPRSRGAGGLLTLQLERARVEEDAHKVQVATMFAGHAAIAVENARLFEEVRQQAITDSLTGLYTRRHFSRSPSARLRLARRKNRALSVLMVDVDHFGRR